MKKLNLLALLGLFVGLMAFTSCSNSDDDANDAGYESIVGNWKYQFSQQDENMSRNVEATLALKGDNTFELTVVQGHTMSQGPQTRVERFGSVFQGEYTYVGEKLTLSFKQQRNFNYNEETQADEWEEWNTYEEVREGTARWSTHELVVNANEFDMWWAEAEGDLVTFKR